MPHFQASLSLLPTELIDEIIILSTFLGDARASSALARTCRRLRSLVYCQQHRHLWRQMFLIIFDDPRPACNVHTHGRAPRPHLDLNNKSKGKGKSIDCSAFDDFPWEEEYKLRIWAESFILRRTRPPVSDSRDAPSNFPSTDDDLYIVLETLLRVVLTAAPLPYHALASMAPHCRALGLPHAHPIFSPILIAAHSQRDSILDSRNTRWLARVFERGLPRELMARLTAVDENGDVDIQKKPIKWDGLLAKLVAQVGLMIPIGGTDHTEAEQSNGNARHVTPDSEVSECSGESDQVSESGDEAPCTSTMTSVTTSPEDVRRLARMRVYNMAYLEPSRIFGPFLPLESHHEMPVDNTMGLAIAAPPVLAIPDTTTFLAAVAGAVDSTSRVWNAAGGTSSILYATDSVGPYFCPPRFPCVLSHPPCRWFALCDPRPGPDWRATWGRSKHHNRPAAALRLGVDLGRAPGDRAQPARFA